VRLTNSFIPVDGVGERTERALWQAGVTQWEAFDGPTVPGVGPTLADRINAFVAEASDRLDAGDARYFAAALPERERWRLFRDFQGRTAFLDIETTGLSMYRDDVTVVSVHQAGETTTLVRGRDLSRAALEATLGDAEVVVTYNGAQFDVPFLESAFDLQLDHAHIDLRYPCRRVGLTGGLSAIERALDIDRKRPELSGQDAVRLWNRYAHHDDEDALASLIDYNQADTTNLVDLTEIIVERLRERVFEAAITEPGPVKNP
jgi:uncharacterized protein YprB with RNaseH-like and TPR domain